MRVTKILVCLVSLAAACLTVTANAANGNDGVTKDKIVIGTIQDLSGPLAQLSKEALNGMLMAVDEINDSGGVNGRKLDLKVADHGYQPQKAVLAARRMVQRDHIFANISEMGSVTTMATIPVLEKNNVLNLWPMSGDVDTYLPRTKLKWSTSPSYAVGSRIALRYLLDHNEGVKKVCVSYQNDEYGSEVLRGITEMLPYKDAELTLKVSFPRGTTNFTSNVGKLQAADCQLVVIGAALREPAAILKTAHKLGWDPIFMGNLGSYSRRLPELGGEVMNGFYSPGLILMPYTEGAESKDLENWATAYEKRFGQKPDVFAVYGYQGIKLFAHVAEKAGKDLTVDSFVDQLEQTTYDNMFGAHIVFGPDQHEGTDVVFVSQIVDGKWQSVTDPITIKRRWPLEDNDKYAAED